jgi:myo-inositol-1(or 4)-monophosphatase
VPQFAVSVACEDREGTVVGVVLDPLREECFSGRRSGGAELNGEPIAGTDRAQLSTALVATGFSYDVERRVLQARVVARVIPKVRDIRRGGAAALDLAWCACGRYDAYYERGVETWDYAAGALIAHRAGLEVRALEAGDDGPPGLMVAPPALVDELAGVVLGR